MMMIGTAASTASQLRDAPPSARFSDTGPPRPARHIVFYRRAAISNEQRRDLEAAPAAARLEIAEPWLDAWTGECGLTDDATASSLAFAICMSSARGGVLAWCIMPSHVHVLMCDNSDNDLFERVRCWMASAQSPGFRTSHGAASEWDTRFFAETIRGDAGIAAVRRHIEGKPVAAGLASSPGSWPWSSASKDLGRLRPERRASPPSPRRPDRRPQPQAAAPAPARAQPSPPPVAIRRAMHVMIWLNDALPGGGLANPTLRSQTEPVRFLDRALDKALDKRRGRRSLARRSAAMQVRYEILSGDGARYGLIAWCVMPTHVHVLVSEVAQCPLSDIVARWKSKTLAAANARRLFRDVAAPWADGYARAEIVGDEAIEDTKSYIEYNPVIGGLTNNPNTWPWSSASAAPVNDDRP